MAYAREALANLGTQVHGHVLEQHRCVFTGVLLIIMVQICTGGLGLSSDGGCIESEIEGG